MKKPVVVYIGIREGFAKLVSVEPRDYPYDGAFNMMITLETPLEDPACVKELITKLYVNSSTLAVHPDEREDIIQDFMNLTGHTNVKIPNLWDSPKTLWTSIFVMDTEEDPKITAVLDGMEMESSWHSWQVDRYMSRAGGALKGIEVKSFPGNAQQAFERFVDEMYKLGMEEKYIKSLIDQYQKKTGITIKGTPKLISTIL